jgi:hypothetical protein
LVASLSRHGRRISRSLFGNRAAATRSFDLRFSIAVFASLLIRRKDPLRRAEPERIDRVGPRPKASHAERNRTHKRGGFDTSM